MKTFSEHIRKHLYACLFGPLAILPASILYALFFELYTPTSDYFELIPVLIIIGLMVAYPITILLGLPVSVLLNRANKFRLSYLTIIVLIGSFISILISGGGLSDFIFIAYFSIFVSTFCWYLHKVG